MKIVKIDFSTTTIRSSYALRADHFLLMAPRLIVIYVLNYVDRNNLSASKDHGFKDDLMLKGTEYSTLLSVSSRFPLLSSP